MSPLEWLRRQRPPLSPRHRARFLEVCDAMDAAIRAGEGPAPIATAQIDDALPQTDAEAVKAAAEQTRAAIARYPTPPPRTATFVSAPMLCPCVAIYSVCMCKNTNIRAQTNPSDFRADQRR